MGCGKWLCAPLGDIGERTDRVALLAVFGAFVCLAELAAVVPPRATTTAATASLSRHGLALNSDA